MAKRGGEFGLVVDPKIFAEQVQRVRRDPFLVRDSNFPRGGVYPEWLKGWERGAIDPRLLLILAIGSLTMAGTALVYPAISNAISGYGSGTFPDNPHDIFVSPPYNPTPEILQPLASEKNLTSKRLPVTLKTEIKPSQTPGVVVGKGPIYFDETPPIRDKNDVIIIMAQVRNIIDEKRLTPLLKEIHIVDANDEHLRPRGYGTILERGLTTGKASVFLYEDGLVIYATGQSLPQKELEHNILHEVGHGLDPNLNPIFLDRLLGDAEKAKQLSSLHLKANQSYFREFLAYGKNYPPFGYERSIIYSKSLDLGTNLWGNFLKEMRRPLGFSEIGSFVIQEEIMIATLEQFPPGSIFSRILSNRIKNGTYEVINDFTPKDLGWGLIVEYFLDKEGLKRAVGQEFFSEVETAAEETVAIARKETYAELFVLTLTDPHRARVISPDIYVVQRFLLDNLRATQ